MPKEKETVWSPQPGPQEAAIRAPFVDELFYGGAAGGGKSDFLLDDYLMDVEQGEIWSGILFRQSYPALEELVERSHQIFPKTGAIYKVGASEWIWPNGAKLKFRHMENIFDFTKYQGHQYSWIGYDELPEWPLPDCYMKMISRLRGLAQRKRIRSTGNPGGVGHSWVQSRFRIPRERTTYKESEPFVDPKTEMTRLFIPSRVQDNKILMAADPQYITRLKGVGDEELVKAWLDGDWSALVGAYFGSVWNKVELVDSFDIPDSWTLFTGLDYGEASPTAWYMGAVDYDKNLWIINEYYEADRSASEHAEAISQSREGYPYTQRRPTRNVADPSIFVRRRLDESRSRSAGDVFRENGIHLKPGNNDRINGWRILRDIISKGKLKIFKQWCPNLIRTLPALPRDERRPEDVNTDADDHAADALRYMVVHIYGPGKQSESKPDTAGSKLIENIFEPQRKRA